MVINALEVNASVIFVKFSDNVRVQLAAAIAVFPLVASVRNFSDQANLNLPTSLLGFLIVIPARAEHQPVLLYHLEVLALVTRTAHQTPIWLFIP